MYVCMYGWMDGFMYVCLYVCMYVCVYVFDVCIQVGGEYRISFRSTYVSLGARIKSKVGR